MKVGDFLRFQVPSSDWLAGVILAATNAPSPQEILEAIQLDETLILKPPVILLEPSAVGNLGGLGGAGLL